MLEPCVRACMLPLDCTCAAGEYAAALEAAVVLLPVASVAFKPLARAPL